MGESYAAYYPYWAKTDRDDARAVPSHHLLAFHGLDVAACAHVLLEQDEALRESFARLLRMEAAQVLRFLPFLIALHDFGKFSDGFQNLNNALFEHLRGMASRADYQVRHDTLGLWLWEDELCRDALEKDWFGGLKMGVDAWDFSDGLRPLIQAVMGHHGQPPMVGGPLKRREHFSPEAVEAARALAQEYARLFLKGSIWPAEVWGQEVDYLDDFTTHASWLLAGFAVLSDWLGSNEEIFSFQQEPMPLEEYWREKALPRAQQAVRASGMLGASPAKWRGFEALFPKKSPRPMQAYAADVELSEQPQLFILEDATGSGKTEAALILAHRLMAAGAARGFYVALPTMATANAMYGRMARAYHHLYEDPAQASLVLAHGASWLHGEFQSSIDLGGHRDKATERYASGAADSTATAQCTRWLSDNRKKALLAQVGVGTIDQALMAVLPSKHQSLRLLGLSQKVLIVDEVHAYDSYMHGLLKTLLQFHAAQGGSAILLSATLPQVTRQELCDAFLKGRGRGSEALESTAFPLATRVSAAPGASALKETKISRRPDASREVAVSFEPDRDACIERILEARRAGQCVCWIRNTVADAVEAHQLLAARMSDEGSSGAEDLMLFHARFALADRQEIEDKVLRLFGEKSTQEERAGKILVATQVVEQSLDIDFDFMVTDLAPVELVVQRAGRLHRHQRAERPGFGQDNPGSAPQLLIHGPRHQPEAGDEVEADWYSRVFPIGTFVYRHVAQLWLSAKVLAERAMIRIPEDARLLVESVYGPEADELAPRVLVEASAEAEGDKRADKSMAIFNSLEFNEGYSSRSSQDWFEDARTPTRLADPSTTVRLGRVGEDGRVEPWAEAKHGAYRWALSELSVRTSQIAAVDDSPGELAGAINDAVEQMPDRAKWSVLIPLSQTSSGRWSGWALDAQQNRVEVEYSPQFGLQIIKNND